MDALNEMIGNKKIEKAQVLERIKAIQKEIDEQQSLPMAYKVFARFAGNDSARVLSKNHDWEMDGIDPTLFKNKLKHMA